MHLNHVTLPAGDYEASVAFYRRLGLAQIVAAPPHYARFEMMPGGSTLSIEVMAGANRAGSAQIFLACADVDAEVDAAEARGLSFDQPPATHDYLWRQAGTLDPHGNRIILYHAGISQRFPPWRLDGRTGD